MKRGTPDHPKTIMLAMELEKIYATHRRKGSFGGKSEAVGLLEVLWDWCSKYAIQGDIGKWPDEVIANGIGWIWSGKELIYALVQSRWLDKAPEPFRLVIHDIKDHATNTWRQNLEDAGLTWWDGSDPRKYKLQKNSRKTPEDSRKSPQPETQTQTEPQTQPIAPPVRVDVGGLNNGATDACERIEAATVTWPLNTGLVMGRRLIADAVAQSVDQEATLSLIERNVPAWAEHYRSKPIDKRRRLDNLMRDGDWQNAPTVEPKDAWD